MTESSSFSQDASESRRRWDCGSGYCCEWTREGKLSGMMPLGATLTCVKGRAYVSMRRVTAKAVIWVVPQEFSPVPLAKCRWDGSFYFTLRKED